MNKRSWRTFAISFCVILIGSWFVQKVEADDWNYWRGPNQNGISNEINLVESWSLDPAENVLWVSPIGGRATPIILNDRVYLNCRTEHDFNDVEDKIHLGEQVVCWDAKTGDVIWRDVFNVFQTDIPAPRVGWAAMCGDTETGNVYVHSVSGMFRCYDADGNVVWEHSLLEEYGKISGYGGRTQTPIIDENRIIVSYLAVNWGETKGPAPKHYYYAFDKKNGELLWVSAPGGQPKDTNYSAPFIMELNGQRALIGGNSDGGIYAINSRTGAPIWGFRMSLRGLNCTPVTDGKYVYVSHGEDNIDNREFGRVQCIDPNGTGDITETGSVWRKDGIKAGYTALLVKDGILYVVADTGIMYAFDSETGDILWEHAIGTVGKGSPVWADGKIYVMEVNGRVHVLKPSRDGCETVSHVELMAGNGEGTDEIYASPAISNGRIVLVTRDRTICLGSADSEAKEVGDTMIITEAEPGDIASIQAYPYETYIQKGGSVEYRIHAFDENGVFVKELSPDQVTLSDSLASLSVDGSRVSANELDGNVAGTVTISAGGMEATSRLRAFNSGSEWAWNFDGYEGMQVPQTWLRAHVKIRPEQIAGVDGNEENVAMKSLGIGSGKGRPSHMVWFGTPEMKNYTIQADVLLKEQRRSLSSVGITNQRYNLILKGNNSKLEIQSWAAHLRLNAKQSFRADPDVWYTMKMSVDVTDGEARIYGKVWKANDPEPADWTIEAVDPRANESGSPGIYMYSLADCYFDNIKITPNE